MVFRVLAKTNQKAQFEYRQKTDENSDRKFETTNQTIFAVLKNKAQTVFKKQMLRTQTTSTDSIEQIFILIKTCLNG